ncbi:MAG: Hsp70 family protein [Selenomonadaceae bacterium]|nr:Hsp70 family protein [Selenomonadaceae bacterium]
MVVGIDLGTTNTLACYFVNGRKKLLKFTGGATMLPSVIYTDDDGKVIVGQAAQARGAVNPSRMIRSAKTYIGNFELNKKWKCGNRIYTPTDVATEVLKKVRQQLVKSMRLNENEEIGAVITVPAYFNDNQRDETRKAGIAAGFKVMWILEEPTAAAIEAVHEMRLDKKVFVVDIGGGTFDLSVLEADHENHTYTAIAIDGDDRLGGDDFDRAVQQEFIRHIEDDTGIKLTDAKSAGLDEGDYQGLMNRLLSEARQAKESLSDVTEHKVTLPNLTMLGGQNYDLDFTFTRKAFEATCKPLFDRIFNQLNEFVRDNKKFKLQDIGHVILAGGTCFIPYIKERIEQDLKIKPNDELPLSQLVVTGAARVAESREFGTEGDLEGTPRETIIVRSILAHSLGIEVLDNNNNPIFDQILAKDTPYPCEVIKNYVTTADNQTQIEVNVYEAGKEGAKDLNLHRFRGSLNMKDLPPAPAGKTKVSVKFEYTEDQRLKVTVTDVKDTKHFKEALIDKTAKSQSKSTAAPIDMVLMLDSSGSMIGYELDQAKDACSKLINEMIDLSVHRLSLMSFDSSPHMYSHLTNDRKFLIKKLMEINASGSTEMVEAFRMAYGEVENSTRQRIALMVTDGYPDEKSRTITCAKQLRDKGLKIIAIGVGSGFDKNFLDSMVGAENSFTINNMSELTATFKKVMDKLKRG